MKQAFKLSDIYSQMFRGMRANVYKRTDNFRSEDEILFMADMLLVDIKILIRDEIDECD